MNQSKIESLTKEEQLQSLINVLTALDSLKLLGSDALLFVQIKNSIEKVVTSLDKELSQK
jgi:hypothetical protein